MTEKNELIAAILAIGVPLLGSVILFIIRSIWKENAAAKEAIFRIGVGISYDVVNNIALTTETKIDDKVAEGLRILRDFLNSKGQELTPAKASEATILFNAMHGAEAMEKKLAQADTRP